MGTLTAPAAGTEIPTQADGSSDGVPRFIRPILWSDRGVDAINLFPDHLQGRLEEVRDLGRDLDLDRGRGRDGLTEALLELVDFCRRLLVLLL